MKQGQYVGRNRTRKQWSDKISGKCKQERIEYFEIKIITAESSGLGSQSSGWTLKKTMWTERRTDKRMDTTG